MNSERKSALTVFLMVGATLVAKLLGMLRGVFLAASYGTGTESEAFAAASKIPLTFFDLLLGAAILGCFIPIYNGFSEEKSKEANSFACTFLNTIIIITGLLSLLGIVFSDGILQILSPKLNRESAVLASRLLKIMFPMITFTGSAYVLVGVLQSKGSFIIPSLISAVSNGAIIAYFLFFDSRFGIEGLAFAYFFAWILQLAVLIPPLFKTNYKYKFVLDFKSPEMKKAFKSALPIMAGSWLSPATVLIGTYFAPFTMDASPLAVFDYANNLFIIIAGILTYGLCNFIFPSLSRLSAGDNHEQYAGTVKGGLSAMLLIIVPVAMGVIALGQEIVCLVYMRGNFSVQSAMSTSCAFVGFSLGIIGYSLIEILNRVFYSKGKTSPPVVAALIGITVNISICTICTFVFKNQGIPSLLYVSGAVSAGLLCAAGYLFVKCKKEISGVIDKEFFINTLKIFVSGGVSLISMLGITSFFGTSVYERNFIQNFLFCMVVFVIGVAVFLVCCFVLKIKECKNILNIVGINKKDKEGD